MLEGVCYPDRLLALLRDFIVFEDDGGNLPNKKITGYHQFHAVQVTDQETLLGVKSFQTLKWDYWDERQRWQSHACSVCGKDVSCPDVLDGGGRCKSCAPPAH